MEAVVKYPITNGAPLPLSRSRRKDLHCRYRILNSNCSARRSSSRKAGGNAYEVYYNMRKSYRHRLEKAKRRQVFLRGYNLSFAPSRRQTAMSSFTGKLKRDVSTTVHAAAVSVMGLARQGISFLRRSKLLPPSHCFSSWRKGVL